VSDDFFDKIDAKLGEQKAEKAAKDDAAERNLAFVKRVVPELVSMAESYAAKCRDRGMSVKVSQGESSVTFTLQYKNGEKRSVVGTYYHDMGNKLGFEHHFPAEDGKRYKTMPMRWYSEKDWRDDRYEGELKKAIEEFVFHADRQGGL
jgi:hypothetical protein